MQIGKIKRIPLVGDDNIAKGKQLLHYNSIVNIVKILPEAKFNKWDYAIEFLESKVRICVDMEDLSLLVIEYRNCCGRCAGFPLDECDPNTLQIPLRGDHWKWALDKGLVDTDETISFVLDGKYQIIIKNTDSENRFLAAFNKFIDERKELVQDITPENWKMRSNYEIVRNFVNRYYKI